MKTRHIFTALLISGFFCSCNITEPHDDVSDQVVFAYHIDESSIRVYSTKTINFHFKFWVGLRSDAVVENVVAHVDIYRRGFLIEVIEIPFTRTVWTNGDSSLLEFISEGYLGSNALAGMWTEYYVTYDYKP